jgi:hypothetical protein
MRDTAVIGLLAPVFAALSLGASALYTRLRRPGTVGISSTPIYEGDAVVRHAVAVQLKPTVRAA